MVNNTLFVLKLGGKVTNHFTRSKKFIVYGDRNPRAYVSKFMHVYSCVIKRQYCEASNNANVTNNELFLSRTKSCWRNTYEVIRETFLRLGWTVVTFIPLITVTAE